MSRPLQPSSPLAEFLSAPRASAAPKGAAVYLSQRPFFGQLIVRGEAENPQFLKGVEQVLKIPVPAQPNTFAENDQYSILWLGPDEWLILTPPGAESHILRGLADALHGIVAAVTDVTHGQIIIRVRGDRTLDVLSKGCSLDLYPAVFGPGSCAQTLIAKTGVIIRWVEHSCFDLIVRRSFAEYLALWLEDAAQEYGVAVGWDGRESATLGAKKQHV